MTDPSVAETGGATRRKMVYALRNEVGDDEWEPGAGLTNWMRI